jgi:hypothetical protein
MRKQIINLLVMLAIAFPMVAAPIEISFSPNSVSFEQHNADAKSYKRKSYSGGSSWGSTTKKKTPSFSLGGSNKKDTKCVFNCGKTTPKVTPSPSTSNTAKGKKGELDAKGIYKKTDSQDVKASGKKAYDAKNPPAPKIAKGKKAPPSISSKPLSDMKRTKIADNTRKELTAPDLRKTRLQSNNARMAKTRSMKRNDVRRLRNERNYWRSRAQYERNYRYRSYNDYGWGYGFYPGQTFHRGWGPFGYGYTRGGVGVADGIIIASLLGHSNIGDRPIPNDYYVDGDFPDVVSVPLGTTFRTIGKQHYLVIPDGMGSFDNVAIPLGSNMYPTDEGTLIQTPYGASIFMPRTKDAYRPNNDYVVPVYAQQEQVYDEYNNGGSFWSYILSWFQ